MGRLVGYGLRKPAFAGDKEGYMVGVCLQMIIMLSIMLIAYIHFTRHGGLTEGSRRGHGATRATLDCSRLPGRTAQWRHPVIEERLADQPWKIAIRGESGGKQITSREKGKGDRAPRCLSLSLSLSLLARRRVTICSSRGSQGAIPCIRPNRAEARG
jgi:hypothetical protein